MGVVNLFLINQSGNLLNLAFGEMKVKAGLNRSSGHMWSPGISLPTTDLNDKNSVLTND